MKKFLDHIFHFAVLILMSIFTIACGGSGTESTENQYVPPVPTPTTYSSAPTNVETSLGTIWINSDNSSLYTFENDRNDSDGDGNGDSDCNTTCAESWPPMLATNSATAIGDFSIITRDDGTSLQWAFRGLPLYMFANDTNTGDVAGEGVNNVWFVARPDPFKQIDHSDSAIGTILAGAFSVTGLDGSGGAASDRIDREDFTLYVFDNDLNDTDGDGVDDSDCNATCAENWPPLFADNGATEIGEYTIVDRDDGTRQWAYSGRPLYFFVGDANAGEVNGEGLGGIWFIARPSPISISNSSVGGILSATTSVLAVDSNGGIDTSARISAGFALYVFDADAQDVDGDGLGDSDCNSSCAVNWPPLFANSDAVANNNFGIILRDDGSRQWTFKGEPLYLFAGDSSAGDVNGDQVGGSWHLARNAPLQIMTDGTFGDIFAARGQIEDVDGSGNAAATFSDKTGFLVYLFDDDINDVDGDGMDSDCNGGCAVTWPPLYADSSDIEGGGFTIISREDGSLQWAYQEAPLYFYVGDSASGIVNGVYGTWHEVNP